jgi:rubredoxin
MASRCCMPCQAYWPDIPDTRECPRCGKPTARHSYSPDKSVDDMAEARRKRAAEVMEAQAEEVEMEAARTKDYLHEHRVERFMALGFSEPNAELLAAARDALGFPLYHGDIGTALRAGCTHEAAVAIYA